MILGDDPVVERAPIVDLWIKAGATRGRRGRRERDRRSRTEASAESVTSSASASAPTERTILIWSGPGGNGGATVAGLAAELGLAEKPGSGAFHLPETANGRGVADGWAAAADGEDADPEPIELLIVSGDEAAANPDVRALAERAERVLAISMFRSPVAGWADLVLPGHELPRARRDVHEPRGPAPAPAPRGHPALPGRARVDREARRALRRRALAARAADLRRALGALLRRHRLSGDRRAGRAARARRRASRSPDAAARRRSASAGRACASSRYRPLFSGPAVERIPSSSSSGPAPEIELSADDARKLGVEPGAPGAASARTAPRSSFARA